MVPGHKVPALTVHGYDTVSYFAEKGISSLFNLVVRRIRRQAAEPFSGRAFEVSPNMLSNHRKNFRMTRAVPFQIF